MGLRLKLCKLQAEAGAIVLLYGDESEALTHPYLAAPRPLSSALSITLSSISTASAAAIRWPNRCFR